MEADKKLRGAFYHLQRMEQTYLKDEESFIYELEAFLVKLRSVLDVLLEDFNKKFGLGISLEEELYPSVFEERAQKLNNAEAMRFIKWWRDKKNLMRNGKFGSILFTKRNISVHRKVIRPDLKEIALYDVVLPTDSVTIEKYDEKGNLIEELKTLPIPPRSVEPEPPKVDWYFNDFPEENVLEVSRKLYQIVKEFIEEAKAQFN